MCCRRLSSLAGELGGLGPGVGFQRDGAAPHVSLAARTGRRGLGWRLLPHPPYSSGIARSGCRLFLSLRGSLQGRGFVDLESVGGQVGAFFFRTSWVLC